MNRHSIRKSITVTLFAFVIAFGLVGSAMAQGNANRATATSSGNNPICSRIGSSIQVSSGARMYCQGAQPNGPTKAGPVTGSVSKNVDAANPHEDTTPNGTQVYGQAEVSIAAVGSYVVEAWNDATGFFAPCPSPIYKEELTGYGFSANGGASFKDMGGLPNDCTTNYKLYGDPSVETWRSGGTAYFYVSSLYINTVTAQSDLAINACKATGTGSSASLTCSMPIIAATGGPGDFLDKEFLTIDPSRGRLYISYTRFGAINTPNYQGQIELAVCDIGTPSGGTGSAGGTAGTPVCFPGASPAPYYVVAPGTVCENEGAYPAVDVKTGDVYVAWEYNWATNYLGPAPCNTTVHVQNKVAYVPFACLTLTPTSPCVTTPLTKAVNIHSIDLAFIPGYNRNPSAGSSPANDFPRIAVSEKYGTVSIVWNDTRYHPLGDILLQSFNLMSLSKVQSNPAKVNPGTSNELHFLPALRNADDVGNLNISYYDRNTANTDSTNVDAVLDLSPRATGPKSSVLVTNVPSAWLDTSSDIIPNFGDYTDNYVLALANSPYTNDRLYVAWSDGRLGLPQPFEAHTLVQ